MADVSNVMLTSDEKVNTDAVCCNYKHCKKVIVKNKVTCVGCTQDYHPGCLPREKNCPASNQGCTTETEASVKTSQSANTNLLRENELLRRLLDEMEDKNRILKQNVSLLMEKVGYLEVRLSGDSSASGNKQDSVNMGEAGGAVISTVPEMAQRSTISTILAENEQKKKQQQSSNLNLKQTQNTNFAALINKQAEITKNIINLDQKTHSLIGSTTGKEQSQLDSNNTNVIQTICDKFAQANLSSCQEEDEFKVVTKKRRNNYGKQKNLVRGVAENTTVKGVKPVAHLHVCKLDPATEAEELKKYLLTRNLSDVICTKIESKWPEKYSSFKVSVPFQQLQEATNPHIWPEGTQITRFLFRLEKYKQQS